jgi:hypothetical protein
MYLMIHNIGVGYYISYWVTYTVWKTIKSLIYSNYRIFLWSYGLEGLINNFCILT